MEKKRKNPSSSYPLATMVCGVVAAALGAGAFAGWSVGNLVIAGGYNNKIPMAPNTAIKFIFFGTCLALWARRPFDRSIIWLSRIVAVLVAIFSVLPLIQLLTGTDWGIETFLFQSEQHVGQIPLGYTSVFTATAFLATAASFLAILLFDDGKIWQKNLASLLSAAAVLLGSVITIGYLYGSPFLYGGTVVPMASTTAIAFIGLGTGLILTMGKDIWLVRLFSGDSLRSRLMRVFLPLTLIVVIFEGWLIVSIVNDHYDLNLAAASALSAIFLVLLVCMIIFQLSKNIGTSVDNAFEERRRVEDQLRYQAYQLANVNDAIVGTDAHYRLTTWNAAAEALYGWKAEEVLGRDGTEIVRTEWLTADAEEMRRLIRMQGSFRGEATQQRKDVTRFPVEVSSLVLRDDNGQITGYVSINHDITERKQTEEALRQSEEHLHQLFDNMHEGFMIQDVIEDDAGKAVDVRYLDINLAIERFLGKTRAEIIGRTRNQVLGIPDPAVVDTISRVASTGQPVHMEQYSSGAKRWYESFSYLFGSAQVATLVLDITERKQAEMALAESETKLRAIFEQSRDAIGVSRAGTHVMVNPAYVKLFGYENESELFGTSILNLIVPDERDKVAANVLRRVEGEGAPQFYGTRGLRKDGTKFDMDVSVSTYELEGEIYTLVMLRDISEHRVLEESLRQSQKMESVGRLAGGVAHDFNNFLTAVEGYIDLTLLDLPDGSSERTNLLEARHSAERAANLTRQLLLFSRREPLELKLVNLSTLVIDLIKMLERLIGEQYSMVSSFDDDLPAVKADAGQIEQVLMNLVVNARDAMAGGGEIEISTTKMQVDETYVQSHLGTRAGEFVRLQVRDMGSGMDADTLSHIFEPFFTTKGAGTGTGLGLSVVYGIITQHGGWIDVQSKPRSGSTFSIYLPAVSLETAEADVEIISTDGLRGHSEKILLVEDEESVRVLADKMLSSHNYDVVFATSAEEALDLFEEESGEFDMVFSDVMLPGMDGIRLIERLIELKPELRVLLASGFMEGVIFQTIRDKGYRLLEKPYALTDLLRQVREVLEEE